MEIKEIKRIVDNAFGIGDIAKNKAMDVYKNRANAEPLVLEPKTYREVEFIVRYAISLESDMVWNDVHLKDKVSLYLDSLTRFSMVLLLEQLFGIAPKNTMPLTLMPLTLLENRNLQVSDLVAFYAQQFFPRGKYAAELSRA